MGKTKNKCRSVEVDSWVVHVILQCQDCDWGTGDYVKGQDEACKHVLETGHTVKGETGSAVELKPRA